MFNLILLTSRPKKIRSCFEAESKTETPTTEEASARPKKPVFSVSNQHEEKKSTSCVRKKITWLSLNFFWLETKQVYE